MIEMRSERAWVHTQNANQKKPSAIEQNIITTRRCRNCTASNTYIRAQWEEAVLPRVSDDADAVRTRKILVLTTVRFIGRRRLILRTVIRVNAPVNELMIRSVRC
jgi:hypothetical protein